MENNNVVIGWIPGFVVEVKTEDYLKYRFGEANLLWLPKDCPEIFRGDPLMLLEKRDNKLAGEIGWFEAIRRPSYDKESGRIAVKIEYMGAGKMPDDWQKMPRVPAAIKKNDMMTTDC